MYNIYIYMYVCIYIYMYKYIYIYMMCMCMYMCMYVCIYTVYIEIDRNVDVLWKNDISMVLEFSSNSYQKPYQLKYTGFISNSMIKLSCLTHISVY